jgi:SAM-dependent methyltransferase
MANEAQDEHVDIVRRGYDALSARYRADDAGAGQYGPWIAELLATLSSESRVLDLGCGCGVPVSRDLSARGHIVTGVDVSDVQIARARRLVPDATFVRADATGLRLAPESCDAVVALYSIIHMPLTAQPLLLRAIAGWLCPRRSACVVCWLARLDRVADRLARGRRRDVVEPRRRGDVPALAHRSGFPGAPRGVRPRGRQRT